MFKRMITGLVFAGIAALAAGCVTSEQNIGSVTVKRYTEDRPRVDQRLSGNAGYLYGESRYEDKQRKDTRRLYTVEFSKENKKKKSVEKTPALPGSKSTSTGDESMNTLSLPEDVYSYSEPAETAAYEIAPPVAPETLLPQQYTIGKEDTLQKIAWKFYGSYRKWTKIYEANKDVLSDPDHLIPGTTIMIPEL